MLDVSVAAIDTTVRDLLLRLRKRSTTGFNVKKTQQVLALLPGWSMTTATLIMPSDSYRALEISAMVPFSYPEVTLENGTVIAGQSGTREVPMMAVGEIVDGKRTMRLSVRSYDETEARLFHAEVAKLVVTELPDPRSTKSETFVQNLSALTQASDEDRGWTFSFNLFHKVKGHVIRMPGGKTFEVCSNDHALGYGGAKDFGAFFMWALANTDLEAQINALLGTEKHIKAADRPRVPAAGQTLGTCAICLHVQVVRRNKLVNHGYQRPGHGYITGECPGVGHDAYEVSAKGCEAYIRRLADLKQRNVARISALQAGEVKSLPKTHRDRRTGRDVTVWVRTDEVDFLDLAKAAIKDAEQQIEFIEADTETMKQRVQNWVPGELKQRKGEAA
jgi:hypothetical protein